MASMNMVEQLEEQPLVEKSQIDNPEEQGEIANTNEAGLSKSAKMMEHKESRTSTTIMDLTGNIWTHLIIGCLAFFFIFVWFFTRPDTHIQFQMIAVIMVLAAIVVSLWHKFMDKLYRPLRAGNFSCMGLKVTETSTTTTVDLPRHRKLSAELDREIFLFLKPAAQRKFIWGLNWDFYAMFRYRLLTKSKRVRNPQANRWDITKTAATVAADGLSVSGTNGFSDVFAVQPFPISGPHCRVDDFPGTICYYYEVKGDLFLCFVGLSGVAIPYWISQNSNSCAIYIVVNHCHLIRLAGQFHRFELPEGAVEPEMKPFGNVFGCGVVLDPNNNLAIFFTLNGQLLGRKIPISPTVDRLFPAVSVWDGSSFEANFGDDPAKPFVYDIKNCPGLELACI